MKRVLIIGASGFLGTELSNVFRLDKNYETYGTYSKNKSSKFYYLDITELNSVENLFIKIKPDTVIITASLTNVEYCEFNKEETYKINVIGVKNISELCKKYKCKVVYISTEYVFDGKNGPYNEIDEELPINYYGQTKLYAEKIIENEIDNYLIVRTTVVYGWNLQSRNFVMQLIKNLSENKSMIVPDDQISSPTYCPNLAEMIKECCDKNINGIFNIVGNQVMDRYTFAVKAAEILELNKELLIPAKTTSLGQIAKRPLNAGLKIEKALSVLDTKPTSIEDGLKAVKKKYIEYKENVQKEAVYE